MQDTTDKTDKNVFDVPFKPLDHDVVSTKLRSWNLTHPGNLFYADLLKKYAGKANQDQEARESKPENDKTRLHSQYAERILEIITKDRKGRFLKIPEGESNPETCLVMDHKQALHKVVHGLKNKQAALKKEEQNAGKLKTTKASTKASSKASSKAPTKASTKAPTKSPPKAPTSPKQPKKEKKSKRKDSPEKPEAKKKRKLEKSRKTKVIYEAKQGDEIQINPYALELITHVCNCQGSRTNTSILEEPISKYTISEEEPDKERMIRLQLRHRFFSAKAVEMPVVEFARRILQVWGGSLSETIQHLETDPLDKPEKQLSTGDAKGENGLGMDGNSKASSRAATQSQKQEEKGENTPSYSNVPNPLASINGDSTVKHPIAESAGEQKEAKGPVEVDPVSSREQKAPETAALNSNTPQYEAASAINLSENAEVDPTLPSSSGNSLVRNVMKGVAAMSKAILPDKSQSSKSSEEKSPGKRKCSGEDEAGEKQEVASGDEGYTSAKSDLEDNDETKEELDDRDGMDVDEEEGEDKEDNGESTELEEEDTSKNEGTGDGGKSDATDDVNEDDDDDEATATEDEEEVDNNDDDGNDTTSNKSEATEETDV